MKEKTIRKKIFIYLFIFSILILLFLWLFQVIFLDSYYKYKKEKEVEIIAKTIISKYKNTNIVSLLENLSYSKGICIEALSSDKNIYFANNFNVMCKNNNLTNIDKINFISNYTEDNSYKNLNDFNKSDNTTKENITYGIKLENNIYIFITESLVPMDSTINILSEQLIIVTMIVLMLSIAIAYYISKKISKPIININNNSKKLTDGNYNIIFDTNTDIKEIKELEYTLSNMAKELNKTEELRRELLANVSHDLKTPLTMIKAYAEMSRDLNIDNMEKQKENLNIIIDETDRLNLLVNDILELSKIQSNTISLTYEFVDLNVLINNIISKFKVLSEKEKYNFIFKTKIKNTKISCDKKKIEQVIYNLISNAINYTGKDKKVIIELLHINKHYIINIKDTGNGIKEEDLKYIWDKYYKTDKKHIRNNIGTGIGLSIVKNILDLHKYEYGVNTNKNGTTFWFKIPE